MRLRARQRLQIRSSVLRRALAVDDAKVAAQGVVLADHVQSRRGIRGEDQGGGDEAALVMPLPNKWESEYERDILWPLWKAGNIRGYMFEGICLRLGKGAWYTPDWFVVFEDHFECHEVKGFWREAARVRIKVAAGLHRYFKFTAITRDKRGAWKTEVIKS